MRDSEPLCGLFGGTFDPFHYGHLTPVKAVFRAAALARVIYIPAAVPPHRPQPSAGAADRLAMTRIGLAGEADFEVDDIELKRAGRSYTFDTLQDLRRQNPRQRYALLVGLDALIGLETWHRWEELQRSVHIIAISRPGWRAPQPLPAWWRAARVESSAGLRHAQTGKILVAETAPVAISATRVRARIRAEGDPGDWVPPGVRDYICEHNLYAG